MLLTGAGVGALGDVRRLWMTVWRSWFGVCGAHLRRERWRCHRRMIADVVELTRAHAVRHVMPDGRLSDHGVAAGARVVGKEVLWGGAASPPAGSR